jgi:hypothetical protein
MSDLGEEARFSRLVADLQIRVPRASPGRNGVALAGLPRFALIDVGCSAESGHRNDPRECPLWAVVSTGRRNTAATILPERHRLIGSQVHLNKVARQLNERPRKTLQFETPAERFDACVASTG